MMTSLLSTLPAFAVAAALVVIVAGILIWYALRSKGDVFAELTLGKTTFKIDARDRRRTREPH